MMHIVGGFVVCVASQDDENQSRGELREVEPCESPCGENSGEELDPDSVKSARTEQTECS